jgi:hypothetical protein
MSTVAGSLSVMFDSQKPIAARTKKILEWLSLTCGKLHLFGAGESSSDNGMRITPTTVQPLG